MAATVLRWISGVGDSTSSRVIDISGVAVGETMIVAQCIGSTSVTVATPEGWEIFFPQTTMGTRSCLAFVRTKTSSAEVSVTFTASASTAFSAVLIGALGALPAAWIIGPVWTRALHGTTLTNVADGVVTDMPDSVALVLSFEVTSAVEDPNSIAGVDNGFSELGYKGQGNFETIWAGTKAIPTPGDVGDTTITYRNTQSANGAAIMVGLPPGSVSVTAPAVVATGSGAMPAPAVKISTTVMPPTSSASGTAVAPILRASTTVTALASSGSGTIPAPVVHIDARSTPPASTGTGTSPAPSVSISVDVIAGVSSGAGTMPAPTIGMGTKASPPASIGTGQAIAPAVKAGVTLSVPAATGSGAMAAPTVTSVSGVVVFATSAEGMGQAYAPTLHAGVTVSAPAALGYGMMPAPGDGSQALPVSGILVNITPSRELRGVTPSRDLVAITPSRGLEAV